jgi:hypothetical protein
MANDRVILGDGHDPERTDPAIQRTGHSEATAIHSPPFQGRSLTLRRNLKTAALIAPLLFATDPGCEVSRESDRVGLELSRLAPFALPAARRFGAANPPFQV